MHQGFLDEELAAVNAVPEYYGLTGAGPAVNEALAAESLDIGLMGSTPAVTAKSQGIDTTVIAAKHDDQGGSIFVMGDSDIQSVEDLKGKSIGVTMGSEWQKSLDKTLELYGMTESDVEIVNLTLADLWEALTLKQVDAIENALPNLRDNIQSIIDGEVRIVADARNYDELESHGVFVVRTKFKEEHPEIVQAFVDAIYRAYLYADEHPDILRSEVTYSLDLYDYAYPNGPDNSLIADEAIVNYAQSTIDFMLEKDLILQGFDASAWIDNTFYEKAVETIGN
jgi:sulfonate transport system substrate-binding protein